MASSSITTSTIGFPRIGPNREMKKALERFAPCLPRASDPVCSRRCLWALLTFCVGYFLIQWQCCSYWKKQSSLEDLLKVNDQTEKDAWQLQAKAGKSFNFLTPCSHLYTQLYRRWHLTAI